MESKYTELFKKIKNKNKKKKCRQTSINEKEERVK